MKIQCSRPLVIIAPPESFSLNLAGPAIRPLASKLCLYSPRSIDLMTFLRIYALLGPYGLSPSRPVYPHLYPQFPTTIHIMLFQRKSKYPFMHMDRFMALILIFLPKNTPLRMWCFFQSACLFLPR